MIGWPTGFADLAYVTATADCLANRSPLATCDPYGRPFTPYSILPGGILAVLGIGLQQTGILGVGLAATWVLLVGAFSLWLSLRWHRSALELVVVLAFLTAAAIAPPSLLAVERGTLDIVVVALAALGLLMFTWAGSRLLGPLAGSLMLGVSVLLKYFAVGVFAAFLAPRRWRILPIITAVLCIGFLLLNLSDLEQVRETAKADVASTSRILFSSTTGLVTLLTEDPRAFFPAEGQHIDLVALRVIGALIVLAWSAFFVVLLRHVREIPYSSWLLITGGGFILLVPYFLGDSNDYRLIALALPLVGILRWRSSGPEYLWMPAVLAVFALMTGSAMVPNEFGFLMPKTVVIAGDLALAGVLGFVVAVWVKAWLLDTRPERSRASVDSFG